MKNQAHVQSNLYLLFDTDLSKDEFQTKFHQDNIVGAEVHITLSDGTIHKVALTDLLSLKVEEFVEEEEEKEEATKPEEGRMAV